MKHLIIIIGIYFLTIISLLSLHLKPNAVINVSIILAIIIMQLDNLYVCYKVTDLIQNENTDLYKHYKGPYSLFKRKRLVLNSIWFTKKDRDNLSTEVKRLFLRQRIDYIGSVFFIIIWIVLILEINF